MPLGEGAQFAGFTVVRLLGAGGMGEVYLVRHPRLPRYEALKILRAEVSVDADYRRRFDREADLAAGLWHPHIVGVHDRGECEGQLWISMDYVDGPDTAALLRERYPAGMPAGEVAGIVAAVAGALDYAHHRGLLHRDVKPANIMITRPDGAVAPRILLSDFGIARTLDDISGLTVTNMTVGTVVYAAPEQLMGNPIDGRADQYALAASAYHLLTGVQLFAHPNPVAVISAHLNTGPPLPGAGRPELACVDAVFARALAKDPAERFDRCTDFADALARELQYSATGHAQPAEVTLPAPTPLAGGQPFLKPSAGPPPVTPPTRPHPRRPSIGRKRIIVSVLSMLAVLITVAGATVAVNKITAGNAVKRAAQDREAARLAGQQYLEALAAGDAQTALALGAEPPGAPKFLTDKALRAQLVTPPVTDIVVTNDANQDPAMPDDAERLVLGAKFGAIRSQTSMWVRKKGGQWKLDTTTIALSVDYAGDANEAMKAVAISGVPTNGMSPIRVFPGTPQISSSNRYIDITAPTTPLLLNVLADTAHRPGIQPVVALNDTGREASFDAIDARVHYCMNGGPQPAGCCPTGSCYVPPPPGGSDAGIDDDSVKVLNVENTQNMTYDLDPDLMSVHVTGTINYHAEGRRYSQPAQFRQFVTLDSTVDLTKEPPVYVPKQH